MRTELHVPRLADQSGIVSWIHSVDERLITRREPPLQLAGGFLSVRSWVLPLLFARCLRLRRDRKLLRGLTAIGDQKVDLEQVAGSALCRRTGARPPSGSPISRQVK